MFQIFGIKIYKILQVIMFRRKGFSQSRRRNIKLFKRNFGNKKNLCSDHLKYQLLNSTRQTMIFNQDLELARRQRLYDTIYVNLYLQNRSSVCKVQNMYIFLYARYYTTRFMAWNLRLETPVLEDDETLKRKFKDLLDSEIASETEFQNRYLAIVKELRQSEESFENFVGLDKKVRGRDNVTPEEAEILLNGFVQTDLYLEKKVSQDLNVFRTRKERIILLLKNYRFLNGWITAAGVSIIGFAISFFR